VDRKRFLVSSAGLSATVLYGPFVGAGSAAAAAVTDDDLAFANFGVSAEFLLKDFFVRALATKRFGGLHANVLRQGRRAANNHAAALSNLLTGPATRLPSRRTSSSPGRSARSRPPRRP
jgi:hypothetical protein